jgi:hypothetical protein
VIPDSYDLSSQLFELRILLVELDNLRGADECEVKRVEEEHDPLALEGGRRKVDDLVIEHCTRTQSKSDFFRILLQVQLYWRGGSMAVDKASSSRSYLPCQPIRALFS